MTSSLVSIVVITYNSSKFIGETLNSIKLQTYNNIELIITDDGSDDNTIEICKDWLDIHKDKFYNTKIITVTQNTGIPANCNRGISEAKGEWIKLIAGDDTFKTNAIDEFVRFVENKNDCYLVHSNVDMYQDIICDENQLIKEKNIQLITESLSSISQFSILSFENFIFAPTVFINKKIIESVGLFDETIKNCEDWPYWLNCTANGFKFYYINKSLINYRIHGRSIFNGSKNKDKIFSKFIYTEYLIYKKYIKYKSSFTKNLFWVYNYQIKKLYFNTFLNNKTKLNIFIYRLFNLPYSLYKKRTLNAILKKII